MANGYKSIVNLLKEFFRGKMLSDIPPFLIEKYKQKRLSQDAKASVNWEPSRLRTLYNLCIKWKKYEGLNPARRNQIPAGAGKPGQWMFMTNKGSKRKGNKHWEAYKGFRTPFENACKRANLSDVTPHVLGYTFASRPVMAGVNPGTLQELGDWKRFNMVQRYAHLSREHKQRDIELLRNSPEKIPTLSEEAASAESSNLKLVNNMGR